MLSRFSIRARGLDPYPERELRHKYRMEVNRRCGVIDVGMLASDDGSHAWKPAFRPPSNSAFEGSLPVGRLWWFPRIDMADLVLSRIPASLRERWFGSHLRLCPVMPWKSRCPKLASFERVISWPADVVLFVEQRRGVLKLIRDDEDLAWAVFQISKCA